MKVLVRVRYIETDPKRWEKEKNLLDDKIKIKDISTFRPPVAHSIGRDQCPLTDSGPIIAPLAVFGIHSETLLYRIAGNHLNHTGRSPRFRGARARSHHFFTTACREVRGALVTNKN